MGFVSNSSSSSFVLHTNFTPEEFEKILRKEGLYNSVKERIVENQLGKACITGWTSMWNSEEDMGEELIQVRDMLQKNYGDRSYMVTVDSDY